MSQRSPSNGTSTHDMAYYRNKQYKTSFNPYNIHIADMYYADSSPSTPRPTILMPNNKIFVNKEKPKTHYSQQCCVIQ